MSALNNALLNSVLRRRSLIVIVFIGLMAGTAAFVSMAADMSGHAEFAAADGQRYRLGAGDVINITVYDEDDLSRHNYRLPDSGLITFPFGEVRALGLSLVELETLVADGLRGGYLINPRVSVSMEAYRPFFINGQVGSPGAYPYQPGMTVRKAVTLAGGFKERASESKIFVVRETDPQHTESKIDLDGAISPGDTVTVNESFF